MAKGIQSHSAFRDTLGLPYCRTHVIEHLSFLAYSSRVFLYRCQDICHLFHFHCTKIDEQDVKTIPFC